MELIIILVIVAIILISILKMYNDFIKLKNKIKQSESGIDVYLNQRFDLIPNLVECVKSYTKYEAETLDKIVELRNSYNQNNGLDLEKATELNNNINKIIFIYNRTIKKFITIKNIR